ncbi:MAG: glycosyltransferase [Planctomycetaceae bacterium]
MPTLRTQATAEGSPVCSSRDVTIVIPQHNRFDLTLRAISSFREHHGRDVMICVVDDGSNDGLESIRATLLKLDVRILQQPYQGVTAAWNCGWRACDSRWLVFLNNDSWTTAGWLDRLLRPLQNGDAIMSSVGWRRERYLPRALEHMRRVGLMLDGSCFAIARENLAALRGFDPAFRLYFSDTDLQLRLLQQHGRFGTLTAVANLGLKHIGHATTRDLPGRVTQWRSDHAAFIAKWSN